MLKKKDKKKREGAETPTAETAGATTPASSGASKVDVVPADIWEIPWWLKLGGTAGWYAMGVLAVVLILLGLFSMTATLAIPLLFAAILGAVFSPAVDWLVKRHGWKRWIAALLILFAIILVFAGIAALLIVGVVNQWPEISAQIQATVSKAKDALNQNTSAAATKQTTDAIEQSAAAAFSGLAGYIPQALSALFSLGFAVFIGANILFFMLKDGGSIGDAVAKHMYVGERIARDLLHDAGVTMRNYMLGVSIVGAFNALVVGLGAVILGVPLAGTIAIVTFVMAFIPYFGAVIAGAFAVVMALSSGGVGTAAIMLVIVFLANGVLQTLVNEYAMKTTLSLNPLLVLVVTTLGGLLFGAIGAFLATPVTSIVVHAVEVFDDAGLFDRIQAGRHRLAGLPDDDDDAGGTGAGPAGDVVEDTAVAAGQPRD